MAVNYKPVRDRLPRTLEEAFGPYQRYGLVDEDDQRATRTEWGLMTVCLAAFLVVVVLAAAGCLPGGGS